MTQINPSTNTVKIKKTNNIKSFFIDHTFMLFKNLKRQYSYKVQPMEHHNKEPIIKKSINKYKWFSFRSNQSSNSNLIICTEEEENLHIYTNKEYIVNNNKEKLFRNYFKSPSKGFDELCSQESGITPYSRGLYIIIYNSYYMYLYMYIYIYIHYYIIYSYILCINKPI